METNKGGVMKREKFGIEAIGLVRKDTDMASHLVPKHQLNWNTTSICGWRPITQTKVPHYVHQEYETTNEITCQKCIDIYEKQLRNWKFRTLIIAE